ncbi:MAG TPA: glycoside hydrolase family 57 protein [Burkholderiales bacterium]|nr:glycoside hydrolase family 57 protein [Burkholderiales bacterium]
MSDRLDLVFLWHMHQPDYRDHTSGEFILPWVYLHALKDYTDMAAHFERHPQIRAVVNFVPVLAEQIEDYVAQFDANTFRDPLLRMLAASDLEHLGAEERVSLAQACFRSNHQTMLTPFAPYKRLHEVYRSLAADAETSGEAGTPDLAYLSGSYFSDLVVWYHLAWTGETERRRWPLLTDLMKKGMGFTLDDRQALLALLGTILRNLLPRYRALADSGQIELCCTPQTHPLSPLLLDFASARESVPDARLPQSPGYPGGAERVDAHIRAAQASHEMRFGSAPAGMWPAEGAVSQAFIERMAALGCGWAASGEAVLRASLARSGIEDATPAYRPWQPAGAPGLTMFFRDDRLSDLIGFEYSKWHGETAARHLVGELEGIQARAPAGETPVACIILDGENAWEHYPYNGYYFFEELYSRLHPHERIRGTTLRDLLREGVPSARALPKLSAGSWVYGTMSTWIGDPDKNRAWDLLCAAKTAYDSALPGLSQSERDAAQTQLAVCESSDWFWWFGDYNPSAAVASFDRLYRRNLSNLYELLKLPPPPELELPISSGNRHATHDGTMRRAQET